MLVCRVYGGNFEKLEPRSRPAEGAGGEARQFPNDRAGFRQLLAWLDGRVLRCVVYEPTGCWHRDFEQDVLYREVGRIGSSMPSAAFVDGL